MPIRPQLDATSDTPLYRQLSDYIRDLILTGRLSKGDRLPATRELAGTLGLNRSTVSAAYAALEESGFVQGHVGRGSFVAWVPSEQQIARQLDDTISFATSRPSEELFPLDEFRASVEEVIARSDVGHILQLGSPYGYPPLRRYLMQQARAAGLAPDDDEIVITNGCQQALDLLQRVLLRAGDSVVVEDPVYPGLKNLFEHAGARLLGVPMTAEGLDLRHLARVLERETPKMIVVTPNFQNPTGATLPLEQRRTLLRMAQEARMLVVENDTYGDLRYAGTPVQNLKQIAPEQVVLLRTFSKVSFPGLRVGWVIGPRALLARLAEAKQWTDLHSDHLSQAVMLRFAESGRLELHRRRILRVGGEQLAAVLAACRSYLPPGSKWTQPQGGMNLWVRLPDMVDAAGLLERAQRERVSYLPGRFFEVSRPEPSSLRLSFAGLPPDRITAGMAILGRIFASEVERVKAGGSFDPAPAMV